MHYLCMTPRTARTSRIFLPAAAPAISRFSRSAYPLASAYKHRWPLQAVGTPYRKAPWQAERPTTVTAPRAGRRNGRGLAGQPSSRGAATPWRARLHLSNAKPRRGALSITSWPRRSSPEGEGGHIRELLRHSDACRRQQRRQPRACRNNIRSVRISNKKALTMARSPAHQRGHGRRDAKHLRRKQHFAARFSRAKAWKR